MTEEEHEAMKERLKAFLAKKLAEDPGYFEELARRIEEDSIVD